MQMVINRKGRWMNLIIPCKNIHLFTLSCSSNNVKYYHCLNTYIHVIELKASWYHGSMLQNDFYKGYTLYVTIHHYHHSKMSQTTSTRDLHHVTYAMIILQFLPLDKWTMGISLFWKFGYWAFTDNCQKCGWK